MAAPSILSSEQGEKFVFDPFTITTRVTSDQTGGRFEMYHLVLGIGKTVDYHIHRIMDETLCVIAGEVEFTVSGEKYRRSLGSVAFVPHGVHHGFTNVGSAPAEVIIVFSPTTGQDNFFRKLEQAVAAPGNGAAVTALQKEYDQELIPPGT
jgi:quercetin dioxygenase-like cupin family protein